MRTPVIRLSDSARRALQEAAVDAGGDPLRMRISDRFNHDFFFGLRAEGDLDVDSGGITILLDPSSAQRADGLSIDFVGGPDAVRDSAYRKKREMDSTDRGSGGTVPIA